MSSSFSQWISLRLVELCAVSQRRNTSTKRRPRRVFAFDNVSIPHTQNLRLEMRTPDEASRQSGGAARRAGHAGCAGRAVLWLDHQGGRTSIRMWYVAFDDDKETRSPPPAGARPMRKASDGVKWVKPNLGLVEFAGNKNNNLILTDPAPLGFVNLKVLADPDDPDPQRPLQDHDARLFPQRTRASGRSRRSRARMDCTGSCSSTAQAEGRGAAGEGSGAARGPLRAQRRPLQVGRHVLRLRAECHECHAALSRPRDADVSLGRLRELVADEHHRLCAPAAAHAAGAGPQSRGRADARRHQRVESRQYAARHSRPVARREGVEGRDDRSRLRGQQRWR